MSLLLSSLRRIFFLNSPRILMRKLCQATLLIARCVLVHVLFVRGNADSITCSEHHHPWACLAFLGYHISYGQVHLSRTMPSRSGPRLGSGEARTPPVKSSFGSVAGPLRTLSSSGQGDRAFTSSTYLTSRQRSVASDGQSNHKRLIYPQLLHHLRAMFL